MQSLGSLRICVDRDTAYEQNEVATPRVEPIADWRVQLERERNTGNQSKSQDIGWNPTRQDSLRRPAVFSVQSKNTKWVRKEQDLGWIQDWGNVKLPLCKAERDALGTRLEEGAKLNGKEGEQYRRVLWNFRDAVRGQRMWTPRPEVFYHFVYNDKETDAVLAEVKPQDELTAIVQQTKQWMDDWNANHKRKKRTVHLAIEMTPRQTQIWTTWDIDRQTEGGQQTSSKQTMAEMTIPA